MFAGKIGGVAGPRLQIGGRKPVRVDQQSFDVAAELPEASSQLVTLAVVAREAERVKLAGAQRGEVVDDRARGAGCATDGDHLVGGLPGLHGYFGQSGIHVEVLVQEEVAQNGDHGNPETCG